MPKLVKLFLPLIIIGFYFLGLFPKSNQAFSSTLFQDNFDDPDINSVLTRWEIPRNNCNTDWILKDGKVGININKTGNCETEFTPKDSIWGGWNNYVLEVDMTFVSGTDKNIAFRYSGPPNYDWYDYHFQVYSQYSNVILERVYNWQIYSNQTTYPATNGNTYHLKIIVDGNHLVLYIDNNLVLDYPDAGSRFNSGKIALRAGVGGDPQTEVYFDNVKVLEVEKPVTPIVVLPGLMGSWCTEALATGGDCPGNWSALPEPLDPYDSLISSITNASDINSGGVYTWYYDWRKTIPDLSNQLTSFIDNTVLTGKPFGTKIKLVGHSYGGLIAAKYTEDSPNKVEKLVTSGSPHQGALDAYGVWEGGVLWRWSLWQKAILRLALSARGDFYKTQRDVVQAEIPSIKQILPTFNYLLDSQNNNIGESIMKQRNPQLPSQYSALSNIKQLMATMAGVENDPNQDTLYSIKVKPINWIEKALGLWEDGKPDQFNYSPDGDLTVLKTSAQYTEAVAKPVVTANHGGLIAEAIGINTILSQLGSASTAQIVDSLPSENGNDVLFFLRSPAAMTVLFNGQTYSGNPIFIPNIQSGTANVNLVGTGNGIYHLDVTQFSAGDDQTNTYTGTISVGGVVNYNLNINPGNPDREPLVDANGSISLGLATNKLDEIKTFLNNSNIKVRTKLLLLASVDQIKKEINRNNPLSALTLTHSLRQNVNSYESAGQISGADAIRIKQLAQKTINYLQSAFNKKGQNYSAAQIQALRQLVIRLQTQVNQKGNNAKLGLIAGAMAAASAEDNMSINDYIHQFSAKMYLEEANLILR